MTDPLRAALAAFREAIDYARLAKTGTRRSRWEEAYAEGMLALAALAGSEPAGLREVVADVAAELRWRKAATTDADLARVLEKALAATTTASPTDLGSEYGRLLAERDRLIAEGEDPADLLVPDPPASPTATGEGE